MIESKSQGNGCWRPSLTCDVCRQPITDYRQARVVWSGEGANLMHVHLGCVKAGMYRIDLPTYFYSLLVNVGLSPAMLEQAGERIAERNRMVRQRNRMATLMAQAHAER